MTRPNPESAKQQTSLTGSFIVIIDTDVIIYTSCGPGISPILILRNINQNVGVNRNKDESNRETNVENDVEISQKESGHKYENVDELEMLDFIFPSTEQRRLTNGDNSSDSSDVTRLLFDGFCSPYQSLLHTLQQFKNIQEELINRVITQKRTGRIQICINILHPIDRKN
ncbi:unnamed protein product [Mytilus coruscus]|uniref:Uncharacterized protein n=1 Tax=Mytilus coruscus TaxID=42192 RepID=A0A6J8C059_MYTCO|nr:unnamed protein product [Mytilus coruscus]